MKLTSWYRFAISPFFHECRDEKLVIVFIWLNNCILLSTQIQNKFDSDILFQKRNGIFRYMTNFIVL